jgi:hypothetical protein
MPKSRPRPTRLSSRPALPGITIALMQLVLLSFSRWDEIGLQPTAAVAQGPGPGPAHRIVCKPEKDLKPIELTADMTPVEFAYWVVAFVAYHAGSQMEVAPCAMQQAFFKACVYPIFYNHIKSNIVSGVTPVLGPGNTDMELMRDKFLLEHSLFSLRLDLFCFKQGRGLSMSDAMNELQRLADQSDLGGLNPIDLYFMRYLTITDNPALLEKLLEVQVPTQQLLKDAMRRLETAARTKKTLSSPAAMAAFTEQGVGANAVGRGQEAAAPIQEQKLRSLGFTQIFPYTKEQCKKILACYNTRELCSKCGNNKKKGKKHWSL